MNEEEPTTEQKEELLPTDELNKFCQEFNLKLELEKPFDSMEQMLLRVANKDNETIKQITVDNIEKIQEAAGSLLNKVSQIYPEK